MLKERGKRKIALSLAIVMLAAIFALAGCGETPSDSSSAKNEAIVVSISVTTQPTKTEYVAGETFDPAGMVVTAKYSDNTTKTVTDYAIDKTGALKEGDTSIVITYQNKRAVVKITVAKNSDPSTFEDAVLKPSAGKVKVEAEDFACKFAIEPSDSTWTSGGLSTPYLKNGEKISVYLTVEEKCVVYVDPVMAYVSSFAWDKLVVKMDDTAVTPSGNLGAAEDAGNDHNKKWLNWTEVSFGRFVLEKGKHVLTITVVGADGPALDYINFTCFAENAKELYKIGIANAPDKTEYEEGEPFISDGIKVVAYYSDETEADITNECTFDKTENLTTEDTFVTVSYKGFTVKQKITVLSAMPDLEIVKSGEHKVEAEDLLCSPSTEDNGLGDGGLCTKYLNNGEKITVKFTLDKDYTVRVKGSLAYKPGFEFAKSAIVTMDGEAYETDAVVEGTNDDNWKLFRGVAIGSFTLTAGMHVFQITITGASGPAVDYFILSVSEGEAQKELDGIKIVSSGKTEYTEGESITTDGMEIVAVYSDKSEENVTDKVTIDKTAASINDTEITFTYGEKTIKKTISVIPSDNDAEITSAAQTKIEAENLKCNKRMHASGTFTDYSIVGTTMYVTFTLDKAYKVSISAAMAQHFGINFANDMIVKMDGNVVESGAVVPAIDGWHDMTEVKIAEFTLGAGRHVFALKTIGGNGGGPAVDYFTILTEEINGAND